MEKQDKYFRLPWDPATNEEHYLALKAEFDYAFLQDPKENKYLFTQARLAWPGLESNDSQKQEKRP
ncbi:hypothetical protein H5300_20390 [Vibrio sp. SG41-7]|uniref:hypothetical protein n=1 Tax=Vibrio sp. SG41-7 TaxID=2760973 RepID=UPI0016009B3A|nr:hypothetical protein [Vibrio sp. SG41-7]MBB1465633.1 hypothetical protein [Vibrio sp. SG41-7]